MVERLSTGVPELDEMLEGGIPRKFFVAVTGEPGTGKTILCIHFIAQGVREGDRCIYVTTEESRDSIIVQAGQFGIDFKEAVDRGKLVIIDALMGLEDRWSLRSLDVEELVNKVIEAKRVLGYGRARLVIDSLSAFWLDKPAMARRYSYFVKKVLSKWDFTVMATSQYAITTSLPYHEAIPVRINGHMKVIPIGELVDGAIEGSITGFVEVATLDWNDFKVKWQPVKKFIRHKYSGEIYEFILEGGRRVSVTRDHSLFVFREDGIYCLPSSKIKVGDFVLAPARLPPTETTQPPQVKLHEVLGERAGEIYVHGVPLTIANNPRLAVLIKTKYRKGHDTNRWYWRSANVYPLKVLKEAGFDHVNCEKVALVTRTDGGKAVATAAVRANIKVDEYLMRFLGYYVSEGHMKNNRVILTFNSKETGYVSDAADCVRAVFGLEPKLRRTGNRLIVEVNSKVVAEFLRRVLGLKSGAKNKRIPDLVFNVSRDLQDEFIKALYRGDGYIRDGRELVYTTVSDKLATDLLYLLLTRGVFATADRRSSGGYNVKVSYAGGRVALRKAFKGKLKVSGRATAKLIGVPKSFVASILAKLSGVEPRTASYTHLNKVRVSEERIRRALFSKEYIKLRARILDLLASGPASATQLSNALGEDRRRVLKTLKLLTRKLLVRRKGKGRDVCYVVTGEGIKVAKNFKLLQRLASGDVAFLRVKRIEKRVVEDYYVYDVSVQDTENFVAGFGGVVCHNSEAFGWGVEHIADGIIRFRRFVRNGVLRRYVIVEKMRQTAHDLRMHEIKIVPGEGMKILPPTGERIEDAKLLPSVAEKIRRAKARRLEEAP